MSARSHAPSQNEWTTQPVPAGPTVTLHFRRGSEFRQITLPLQTLRIGSSPDEDLILPSEWAQPQHLIIEYDAGIARIRTAHTTARAFLGEIPITCAGIMFPPSAIVTIPSVTGPPITIECEFDAHSGVLLIDDSSTPSTVIAPPEIAAVSPLDETKSVFTSSPEHVPSRPVRKKTLPRQTIALFGIGIVIGTIITPLYWNDLRRALQRSSVDSAFSQVVRDISQAKSLIAQGHYAEAKSVIDDATHVASGHPAFANQILILRSLSARPEIKLGGLGYVQVDDQWLPPEVASAWKAARQRDDPEINSLYNHAKSALSADAGLELAEQDCDQALAVMGAEAVHPHPMQEEVRDLRNRIHERLITKTMTAKGYVLYNSRWVTPGEQFRLQQDAKGLAFYKGKWISKSAAFAAEQRDRGLILYGGRWMTGSEVKVAQGFVQFEGGWITPQRRTEILQQRQAAAELRQKQAEEARVAAADKAEEKRRKEEEIETKYPDAYVRSQGFVKDILKSPASAQFQPFGSPKVKVTYADGWYTVIAVVDAQNSFGVLLRSKYFCKLKPTGVDQWQASNTYLMDN